MNGMMGGMSAWMLLWGLLSLAVVVLIVIGAVWAVRGLTRRDARHEVATTRSPDLEVAQAELRRRYAAGEIKRGLPARQGRPGAMIHRSARAHPAIRFELP